MVDEAEVYLDLNLQAVLQDIPAIITGVGQGLLHQDQGLSVQGLLDKPERDTVPPLDLGHTDHLPTHEVLDILSILVWLGKMYLLVQGSMDIIQLHLGQGNPTPVQPTQEEILNHSAVAQGNYLESSIVKLNILELLNPKMCPFTEMLTFLEKPRMKLFVRK